jgi:glycosyltransferase involved in cell wall biosynthesis
MMPQAVWRMIARSVDWTTALAGRVRHRVQGMVRRHRDVGGSHRAGVLRLVVHVAALIVRTLTVRIGTRVWRSLHRHRKLLARVDRDLTLPERGQRLMLEVAMRLFEIRYRRHFKRFGLVLESQGSFRPTPGLGLVVVIGTLGPGGSERQAALTLCGLVGRGFGPVALVARFLRSEADCFYLGKLEEADVPACELQTTVEGDLPWNVKKAVDAANALPLDLSEVADYARTLAAKQPAMVHLWLDEVNIKGGLAAVALGIPRVILSTRSLPPYHFAFHQPYMREGYRWLSRQASVVILNNSEAGARAYERWIGLPGGQIQVLRNGFDLNDASLERYRVQRLGYRARHGIPSDAPLVGTVIRLSDEKRPLLWAAIAARVRCAVPGVHFLVVGDGPLKGQLRERGQRADLAGALHVVGYEKEAFVAIAAMDLFLLTSRVEGLPNVLLEAQALGVPVVTTDAGGARETLDHGRTGWVLEQDAAENAGDTVARLLNNREWLAKARDEAPAFVRRSFGVDRMIDETLEAYGMNRCKKGLRKLASEVVHEDHERTR